MLKSKDTIAIFTKGYAMGLIKEGFELFNVEPSHKNKKKLVYVFERTLELDKKFEELIAERQSAKVNNRLSQYDVRTLMSMLSGYEINENDFFNISAKLEKMDADFEKENNLRYSTKEPDKTDIESAQEPDFNTLLNAALNEAK